jgi:CRISPR-associated endonuclease Csn1
VDNNNLTLGLDLGVTSIGWALADVEGQQIVDAGVRIFEAPMDVAKFEAGEPGGSNAALRRKSRMQRRQTSRRQARHRDLYLALQSAGMFPFAGKKAEDRHKRLTDFDKDLMNDKTRDDQLVWGWRERIRAEAPTIADPDQVICYYLRAKAATDRLELPELGRALYHLGQRRGFKSNRREGRSGLTTADAKKEEAERSNKLNNIRTLQEELDQTGLTLGQQLAFVNPHQAAIRNRKRSDIAPIDTGRRMYQDEFEKIWKTQQAHHPDVLTANFYNRIERLMFKQRNVSAGKPGKCELERDPALPRAPKSSLLAQHFRLVQTVNNLKAEGISGTEWRGKQQELIAMLSTVIFEKKTKKGTQTYFGLPFAEVKARLGLHKRTKLNLDDDEDSTYLRGNRTNAIMARAFGTECWSAMEEQERRRIVRKWINESSPEKLFRIARTQWNLDDATAEQLASLEAEEGYAALSHVAMLKLLPHMEQGLTYSEAVKQIEEYKVLSGGKVHEFLPPVEGNELPRIPNPVVKRALTELRKVLNAIIRQHGRPARIRIELARDLKRNAEQREKIHKGNKERERERITAKKWIEERGQRPTDRLVEKVALYKRTRGQCVYCVRSLGDMENIFSDSSGIEVEHILPRRCNDNSFSNKVLAHRACNVRKADRTPRQAWDPSPEWDEMLKFVNALKDKALHDRFIIQTEEELQGFTNRHLSDTRYISKLASEYVELLYGGRDAQLEWSDRVRRCVYASSGALTAEMRKRWGLNGILKPKPVNTEDGRQETKSRDDHRHHAVDAIVIALITESTIQRAAFEAQRHDRASGHLLPRYFPPPWPANGEIEERIRSFRGEVRQAVEKIKVSHRVDHALNGKLNEDTFYGPPKPDSDVAHITKFVHRLTEADIKNLDLLIEDKSVREAIRAQLQKCGNDPKNLEGNLPYLERRDGRRTPIRKVRLAKRGLTLETLRHGAVLNAENHHIVIFKRIDPVAGELWYTPGPVTRLRAMRDRAQEANRIAPKKGPYEIVNKKDGEGATYVMHLMKGDAVEMLDHVNDLRDIYIFSSMSDGDYVFLRHSAVVSSAKKAGLTLSQMRSEMQKSGDRVRTRLDRLREWECEKITLDPLGKVIYTA